MQLILKLHYVCRHRFMSWGKFTERYFMFQLIGWRCKKFIIVSWNYDLLCFHEDDFYLNFEKNSAY